MLVSAALTKIRDNLQEPQTDGAFTPAILLRTLNSEMKIAIGSLWEAGWYIYLKGLIERKTSLSLIPGDDDEEYYAYTSLEYTPWEPSLIAWAGDNPTTYISPQFFFPHRQTEWGDTEQIERITIRGDRLYFYKPTSSTIRVMYVKIPDDYATIDTIDLTDNIINGYLIPKCTSEAMLQDRGVILDDKWDRKAEKFLFGLKTAALPLMNPYKQIPRDIGYDNIQGGGRTVYGSSNNDERL